MKRLAANLERLGLSARLVVADLLDFEPEQPFDAVLLDAPCSATGTLRRHPDIPWTKTPGDIARLAGLQRRMIERAFRLVRPGGLVVYANCSLDPSEGEDLLRSLDLPGLGAAAAPVAPGEFESLAPFISGDGHLRTTPADLALDRPGMSGLDGFFAARFRRLAP
jgi:16S rRNA (cytosine967-C5)-methyltransferase